MFNLPNFPPTVESEKKFKEWSISMKNINFGLVDANNPTITPFKDASGKESIKKRLILFFEAKKVNYYFNYEI